MSAVVTLMSAGEAQRLTQRIKLTASGVRDSLFKLRNLVDEAKHSNVWQVLGYQSWTAYLADTLADEPMRLGRDERQELVGYLSGEGLSTRAIAPIVGVSKDTVQRDVAGVSFDTPSPIPAPGPESEIAVNETTGEVIEDAEIVDEEPSPIPTPTSRLVTGLDGKTYSRPEPKADRRRSLVDDAENVERALYKNVERLREIIRDDRFNKNKANIQDALRPVVGLASEIFADLFDNQSQED